MKLIRESVELSVLGELLNKNSEAKVGQFLESCGRVCYKSEDKSTEDSYKTFLSKIIKSGHVSVIEHATVTAKIVTNRGVSLELVRHRLNNFSQESTRYCNYSSGRFKRELTFIIPSWISDEEIKTIDDNYGKYNIRDYGPAGTWYVALREISNHYFSLLQLGWTPEKAREILPNSLSTTIMMTANLRQWRHILEQRLSPKCHPQMRLLMLKLAKKFNEYLPLFFSDVLSNVALSITKAPVFDNEAYQIIKDDILSVKNDK